LLYSTRLDFRSTTHHTFINNGTATTITKNHRAYVSSRGNCKLSPPFFHRDQADRTQGTSPSLARARKPFRIGNAAIGVALLGFVIGVYTYSIAAVKQDDFVCPPPVKIMKADSTPSPTLKTSYRPSTLELVCVQSKMKNVSSWLQQAQVKPMEGIDKSPRPVRLQLYLLEYQVLQWTGLPLPLLPLPQARTR